MLHSNSLRVFKGSSGTHFFITITRKIKPFIWCKIMMPCSNFETLWCYCLNAHKMKCQTYKYFLHCYMSSTNNCKKCFSVRFIQQIKMNPLAQIYISNLTLISVSDITHFTISVNILMHWIYWCLIRPQNIKNNVIKITI